jgi:cold shock CspA family protein
MSTKTIVRGMAVRGMGNSPAKHSPDLVPSAASRSAAHRALEKVALHQTHQGVVLRYNEDKGFGFLQVAPSLKLALGLGLENDLYVNQHQLHRINLTTLIRGQKVSFQVGKNKVGWQAVNLNLLPNA